MKRLLGEQPKVYMNQLTLHGTNISHHWLKKLASSKVLGGRGCLFFSRVYTGLFCLKTETLQVPKDPKSHIYIYHDRSLYDLRRDSYAQGRKVRIRDMRPGFHYW